MDEFDVIVVGAGAAGCTLAARLSEDPALRVLLLEAGPHDRSLAVRVPAAFPKLLRSARDWGFQTAAEPGLAGRSVLFPRGRTVGGSTSINAQVYTRGHRADFEAWTDEAGPGWAAASLQAHFHRAESALSIEDVRHPSPLSRAFVRAARQVAGLGNASSRAGECDGAGLSRVTQRRGRRWSAADAYLRPALKRTNLALRTGAEVLALRWSEARRVSGVAYLAGGERHEVRARREVALCAGAIGSPHLLLRSGVGPVEHLRAHGIAVRHDLPGVGQSLADHPLAPIVFGCRAPVSLKAAGRPAQLARYALGRRGMLTSNIAEATAFLRTHRALDAPDLELVFAPVTWMGEGIEPPTRHGFTIGLVAVAPQSRGQVALTSGDPLAPPIVRPGYLADPADLRVLAHGLHLSRAIAAHPALQAFGDVHELAPTAGAHTDAEITDALRQITQTIYHPACTCRMGTDALAVTDPELRVRGTGGLRIADASIMPTLVHAHPQAATHVIAERAAELLRAAPRPSPTLARPQERPA